MSLILIVACLFWYNVLHYTKQEHKTILKYVSYHHVVCSDELSNMSVYF